MASNKNRIRILYVMAIFRQNTDENNSITVEEIIKKLAVLDIKADRRTIYSDIECLRSFGVDIEYTQNKKHSYRHIQHTLSCEENEILRDIINMNLEPLKAKSIIVKLENLQNEKYFSFNEITKNNYTNKLGSEINNKAQILLNAIEADKQVVFSISKYNLSKEKYIDTEEIMVSPYLIVYDVGNLYLSAGENGSNQIKHYILSHIEKLKIVNIERMQPPQKIETNPVDYVKHTCGMCSGELTDVVIKVNNKYASSIFDKFGLNIPILHKGESFFITRISLMLNNWLYLWMFNFNEDIQILSPEKAIEDARKLFEQIQNSNFQNQ